MASGTDDLDSAADRLEAALERIAQASPRETAQPAERRNTIDADELAARLDGLIDRLRMALGTPAD